MGSSAPDKENGQKMEPRWYEPETSQPASYNDPVKTPSNGVTIRPLRNTHEDCAFAGKIMVEAFEGKFSHSVTREKLPTTKKILTSYYLGQPPQFYTRNLIAELDGRPVGFLGLKFKGDIADDHADHVCELGCWHAFRFTCFSLVMDSEVKERKKCLVDCVGVDSSCRGRGVGKSLLDRAEQEARKEGCSTIYLMVITTNRARSLYERQGYQVTSTKESCCFGCVAGPPGAYHVMEKQLQT